MALRNPKTARPGQDFDPRKSNLQKAPEEWVTGDQPMTGAQASYLKTLCEEANEEFNPRLSKAQASKEIDRLQEATGRASPASRRSSRENDEDEE